jgi:hypothetical protein
MYKNILFIILTVVVIFLLLYKLYYYYQKQKLINEILEEWKKITNGGAVDKDTETNFKGDYYLSLNSDDYYSHIHLIINDIIFKNPEDKYEQPCYNLCYMAKKYDLHSELHYIDQNRSPKVIVEDMYRELYYFKD